MNKLKKSTFYYLTGTICLVIAIALLLASLIIPLSSKDFLKDNPWLSWVCLAGSIIGLLMVCFSIYLLKKGRFVKIKEKQTKEEDDPTQNT